MALKRKDTPVQFRIDAETLQLFQARCDHYDETVSQALRKAIHMMNEHYLKQVTRAAPKPAGDVLPSEGVDTLEEVKKPSVEPVRQPQSLSERRKAEKLAKQAKMAKRQDRF